MTYDVLGGTLNLTPSKPVRIVSKLLQIISQIFAFNGGATGAARHGQGGHLPPPWKCANGYLQPQSGISNCICCRPK